MKRVTAFVIAYITLITCSPATSSAEVVVNVVGDIMLAGKWAPILKKKGYDHPFGGVTAELTAGDVSLANLESPIARSGTEFTEKKYRFRAEPEVAKAMRKAGFHLVTLANNHSMDFGGQALTETLEHLETAGIGWIGAGRNLAEARRPVLYTIKGITIAFLGYSLTQPTEFFAGRQRPGTAPGWEKHIAEDIAGIRDASDYVIVSLHWGKEGSSTPQAYQRHLAHKIIDAGADVIIGHHPHILQGIENYNNGIIFYSLGNFIFASKGKSADTSAIVRLLLDGDRLQAQILPLDIRHSRVGFQPQLLIGEPAQAVIRKLNALSKPFNTRIRHSNNSYFVSF